MRVPAELQSQEKSARPRFLKESEAKGYSNRLKSDLFRYSDKAHPAADLHLPLWSAGRVAVSSLGFGLAHLSHDGWLGVGLVVINAGFLFGLAYLMTGSLWLSICIHVGYDFFEGSVLGINNPHGLLLSSPDLLQPVCLTGGESGPDSSVLSAVVGLSLVFALVKAYRGWQQSSFRGRRFLSLNQAERQPLVSIVTRIR